MKQPKTRYSFRSVLSIATLICWILPIVIICVLASSLLNRNYNENLHKVTQERVKNAMGQLEMRLESAIQESKAVSYDNSIQKAYPRQMKLEDAQEAYEEIADYLYVHFSRNTLVNGAFVTFLQESGQTSFFAYGNRRSKELTLRNFQKTVLPVCREALSNRGARISFCCVEDKLYMVRYLLDDRFNPFAILTIELRMQDLMQSILPLAENQTLEVTIDGISLIFGTENQSNMDPSRTADLVYSVDADGHTVTYSGQVIGLNLWTTLPKLRWIILSACILVLPMLTIIIILFLRNINRPISVLMEASRRMRNNERGYQIQDNPPNSEFALLYQDFNVMSTELKNQFQQLYEEQQELQQAKIKALQSQINPHFLNNTLEVINWEARMEGNDQVSSMIEALSTMLDAAIGRDGRSLVSLSQEMRYVEAYLYITQVRLGDRLKVVKEINPETLQCTVPLLALQPILENAVEYDLSHTGGELCIRTYLREDKLHLEVEHTGIIPAEGWVTLRESLSRTPGAPGTAGRSVGVRNIVNRIALIYGDEASFDIRQVTPERVLAELICPPNPAKYQQI